MFKWEVFATNISFVFFNSRGLQLNFTENQIPPEDISQHLLLKELSENGIVEISDSRIYIPHDELTKLPQVDKRILNLPENYPFDIFVSCDGVIPDQNFKYIWYFCENYLGKAIPLERIGAFLIINNEHYLLTSDQLILCDLLDNFNKLNLDVKTTINNYEWFAKIKEAANKSCAHLDPYLKSENTIIPDKIQLSVSREDDNLVLAPEFDSIDAENFIKIFDKYPSSRKLYSTQDPQGNRQRVVLSDIQKNEFDNIKRLRKTFGELKDDIINQPNKYFDPNVIDLDNFSKRVIEVGLYKPKFYSFISPYKSLWVPGIIHEKSPSEKIKIPFNNQDEFKQFETAIINCKHCDQQYVEWKDLQIPIKEAENIASMANKQFKDQSLPIKVENDKYSENKVLIIIENIEELGYEQQTKLIDKEFKFCYPPHLASNVFLYDHQKQGIAWLQTLSSESFPGCLLADDMGLGKTLQCLSFIDWHNQNINSEKKPYLIIAPVTLLENWQEEYEKFFSPTIPEMFLFYGSNLDFDSAFSADNKIILTTYETVRSRHQFEVCSVDYAAVFLDEAQRVKTPGTLVTNAVKAIKAEFKIALTGTPVENSLMDIWCIIDFAIPGLLGSAKEFAKTFHNPLKNKDTDLNELGDKLRKKIGVHITRRLKSDVLKNLPPKNEYKIEKDMPLVQLNRYELEIKNSSSITDIDNRGRMLKLISTLRDIADHPYLVDREIDRYSIDQLIESSAKLLLTSEILVNIKEKKEKVIIFADRRETQRLLSRLLLERYGVFASIINGDTPASVSAIKTQKLTRQQIVNKFQTKEDFNAIILSPIATGLGLNITGANNVIHYSRHWNPAKEDQATDRVYRIGQNKDVKVYYPMAKTEKFKTFDIILDEHISRKRALASASLFPSERSEINPFELYDDLVNNINYSTDEKILDLIDLDKLDPLKYESAVALIWSKSGYKTSVTSVSNDKGADVIAISKEVNYLLQVKHSGSIVGDGCVGEILKAKAYYENKLNTKFALGIVTNNYFSKRTIELAGMNSICCYDRNYINNIISKSDIYLSEILKKERERLTA